MHRRQLKPEFLMPGRKAIFAQVGCLTTIMTVGHAGAVDSETTQAGACGSTPCRLPADDVLRTIRICSLVEPNFSCGSK